MNFKYSIDDEKIILDDGTEIGIGSKEAFSIISNAWLRSGWDTKYVYGFTWLGRPVIQLPEDLVAIQEVIYSTQPDVIVETGVAHGGSLVFYASLLLAMGKGKVVGVDIEIRPENRKQIESHPLASLISLVEGDSTSEDTLREVKSHIRAEDKVLVILDSNHSRDHVLEELFKYSELVTPGSFIVACDGIMADMVGAPRSAGDWSWNNPLRAIEEFLQKNPHFSSAEPGKLFNEGQIQKRVTYWPNAYLRRIQD